MPKEKLTGMGRIDRMKEKHLLIDTSVHCFIEEINK
jgi:hypothetical protein